MEPENHPFEKEKSFQTSILVVQNVRFHCFFKGGILVQTKPLPFIQTKAREAMRYPVKGKSAAKGDPKDDGNDASKERF